MCQAIVLYTFICLISPLICYLYLRGRHYHHISQMGSLASKNLSLFPVLLTIGINRRPTGAWGWESSQCWQFYPNKYLLLELCALSTLNALGGVKTTSELKVPRSLYSCFEEKKKEKKNVTISWETSKTEYLLFSLWMFYIWEKG